MRRLWAFALLAGCVGADRTYQDPEGGYTVRVPADWAVARDRGSAVFSAQGKDADKTVTVAVASAPRKEAWRKEPRTATSATGGAKTMLGILPDAKVLSEKRITVGGQTGVLLEVAFTHEGKPFKRLQWVIEGRQRMGYVGYTAPVDRWDEAEAVAQAMAETMALN
jgi:hypothetical protein